MEDSSVLLIITFICLMTGIYSPETVIRNGFPSKQIRHSLYSGIGILIIMGSGFISFFNQLTTASSRINESAAFVFFDETTNEKLAVYRVAQTNFSNHLSMEIQNRVEVGVEYIQLEILLTNHLQTPLNFNPAYLYLDHKNDQKITPIKAWIEGKLILHDIQIEAGEYVFGTFLYLKASDSIDLELKYLPIQS